MLSLFRRKTPPPPPTYNERVVAFWQWFQEVAPRFYATIEAREAASLTDETIAATDKLWPGCAWVYGPGADGKGHSLTLTGEGDIHRQLLTCHWLAQAPMIDGWTFYAARQPGPIKGRVIEVFDLKFDPLEIWVTPHVDGQAEKIDITLWHPAWERLEDQQKSSVTFLFLDEALGEYGTGWWIGEINFGKNRLAESFPLEELADYAMRTSHVRGWKNYPPGDSWTLYTIKDVESEFPRSDLVTLNTAVPKLFNEYMNAKGDLPDALEGSGADYVYVSLDRNFFPPGEEVTRRGQIEDAIEAVLKPAGSGRIVGGGMGSERVYIDLLLFDGKRSLEAVRTALRAQQVPAGTMIEFFAREKRTQRIAL